MNRFGHRRLALQGITALGAALGGAGPAAAVETGRHAPELDIKLLNGKTLTAKQLHGRVVVQMYWATWCPYCRADLADLQRLYQQQHARGLEIVAFSIDESDKAVRDFWKGKHYSFPSAMRNDTIFEHYGRISTTPTYFIIDREGIVRQRINGSPEPGAIAQLVGQLL